MLARDSKIYRVHPKSIPLKNFANFSRTIESYDIKFYTLVTDPIIRNCGKFLYIIYRIDKISSSYLVAVETLSIFVSTIQNSANAVSANTFFE